MFRNLASIVFWMPLMQSHQEKSPAESSTRNGKVNSDVVTRAQLNTSAPRTAASADKRANAGSAADTSHACHSAV
eukprot:5046605-Prymnesium_polylepis.1